MVRVRITDEGDPSAGGYFVCGDPRDSGFEESLVGGFHAAWQPYGATGILDDDALEVERGSVDCGVTDTEVVCESTYEQPLEGALAEIARETGRRGVVVLEEGRVGIDVAAETFADNELGVWQLEPGVKIGSGSCLDAVIRPERLGSVHGFDGFEGLAARVS